MILGFNEVLRQTEEFLLALNATGVTVGQATWELNSDWELHGTQSPEWKLILVYPGDDRRAIYLCIQEALSLSDAEFDLHDIAVEKTGRYYPNGKAVETT